MRHTKSYLWAVVALAAAATGCRQEQIKVYEVAKPRPAVQASTDGHKLALPEGWEEGPPGEMRVGSFTIKGTNGAKAELSIIPLPNQGGGELDNVNRWRSSVGQRALTQDELSKSTELVTVGRMEGRLYEITGASTETDDPTRILGVIVHRQGTGWYFKMMGDDKLVAAQKPTMLAFLSSFDFDHGHAHAHAHDHSAGDPHAGMDPHAGLNMAPAAPTPETNPPRESWPAPASWQQQTPGMMQDAKFSAGGGKAVITVSRAGGGMAANIQRWRGQIGLEGGSAEEAAKQAQPLDLGGTEAKIVDLASSDQRMVVIIVPQGQTSVFYKLMGEPAAVAAEKNALIEFAKKVK